MDFSEALKKLKEGNMITRKGWNGADMFLYYVPANTYDSVTESAKKTFGEKVPYGAYIAIKTKDDIVVPWFASQTDLLSDDWVIYKHMCIS